MKHRWLAIVPVIALSFACASVPNLPPKAGPEEVRLYDPANGVYPEEGYQTIAPVEAKLPLGTPMPDLMMALRAAAAELGADGVILQQVGRNTTGDFTELDREQLIVAEGLAIYYPPAPAANQDQSQGS